jgi:lysophospholipase L1-like esterase
MKKSSSTWLMYGIAVCLPIIFFLLLEMALRLADYGQDYPLFIDNPSHPQYQLPRPDIIKRYFAKDTAVPPVSMEANFLLKDKPENGFRLFVQGGSTAAGYPYGLGASLAGMLDSRVRASKPGHYVEVVNTAMSAVNSYTLLDFADEIIEQQPDAILIYAGHNEFLGILGVGSNFVVAGSSSATRWLLRLRDWRVFQLVQNTIAPLSANASNTSSSESNNYESNNKNIDNSKVDKTLANQSSRTLMSKVAKHKHITTDSELFAAGIAQFRHNMQALLRRYGDAKIPVLLSTIASNEQDHPPFESHPTPLPLTTQLQALQAQINPSQAKLLLDQLLNAASSLALPSADVHFKLGQYCAARKLSACAQSQFALATEHDLLRFRAPAAINDIIRELAAQFSHVELVDAQAALRQRSANQLIGRNVMLEHLHPNVSGYFVIANAFYDRLWQLDLLASKQQRQYYVDANSAWQRRPILPSEEYKGFADVLTLMADYPFTDSPQPITLPTPHNWETALGKAAHLKQVSWIDMMHTALKRYKENQDIQMVIKTTVILADALPHDGYMNLQAARVLDKRQRDVEALYYYQRAQRAGGMNLEKHIARLSEK